LSRVKQKLIFSLLLPAFASWLFVAETSCQSKQNDTLTASVSRAGEIRVFYPTAWEDSAQELFSSTVFGVDSNLVRFEENRKETDPQYYESLYNFELFTLDQREDDDPSSKSELGTHGLIWAIDPKSTLDDARLHERTLILQDTVINGVGCTWIKDVWAKNQIVLWLHDSHSSGENLTPQWLRTHHNLLCDLTHQWEIKPNGGLTSNRHAALEQNNYSDSIAQVIQGKYDIQLCLNASLKLVQATNDFIWLRNENSQFHSNLMVNIYPFVEGASTLDSLISKRNEFSKKYLRTQEGTWVEVSNSGAFPKRMYQVIENGNPVIYLKGWYTELNTDRRGPFFRKIILDNKNQRYIAIDGFLFAPNQPRMSLMRELEIMVSNSTF